MVRVTDVIAFGLLGAGGVWTTVQYYRFARPLVQRLRDAGFTEGDADLAMKKVLDAGFKKDQSEVVANLPLDPKTHELAHGWARVSLVFLWWGGAALFALVLGPLIEEIFTLF